MFLMFNFLTNRKQTEAFCVQSALKFATKVQKSFESRG